MAWATLKCDHKHPSGGKVSAGTTLEIAREFESHDEQGAHQSMALKDESGRVVLTCVDREDCVITGDERGEMTARFANALKQLPDRSLPFAGILIEALEMHTRKSADYGKDDDPYANVRASEEFGVPAWTGGLVRANDKVTRLKSFSAKGVLANESAEDSMLDLCVYFPIVLMLYREASRTDFKGQ